MMRTAVSAIAATVLLGLGTAAAEDGAWAANAAGNWSATNNWAGGAAADGAGATAWFTNDITAGRTVTVDATNRTVGSLHTGDANGTHAFTIAASGGAALVFDNGGRAAHLNQLAVSAGDTLSAPLVLAGDLEVRNASTNKALTLSGSGSFTGTVAILAGTLAAAVSTNALGGAGATVVLGDVQGSAAATLLGDGRTFANPLVARAGSAGTLTVGNSGSAATVFSGPVALDHDLRLVGGGAGSVRLSGAITGSNAITAESTGSVTLSGSNSLYSGTTTLAAGTLNLNHADALGTGAFVVGAGTVNNSSGAAIANAGDNAMTWLGSFAFAGSSALNLGAGPVTLSGPLTLSVNAGTLTVGGALGGGGNALAITKAGSGTLVLQADVALTTNQTAQVDAGTLSLNGVVAGVGFGLTKAGAGTLNLNGPNTYTGTTTVETGSLRTTAAAGVVVIPADLRLVAGSYVATGGSHHRIADTGSVTVDGGSFTVGGGGANGTSETVSNMTVNGGVASFQGASTSGGSFVANGATTLNGGTFSVSGRGETYAAGGLFTINGGSNTLNASSGTTSPTALNLNGGLRINQPTNAGFTALSVINSGTQGGTLGLYGDVVFTGAAGNTNPVLITYALATTNAGVTARLTSAATGSIRTWDIGDGGAAVDLAMQVPIGNGTLAAGGILKAGAGTLALDGALTYTLSTIVSNGTLLINRSLNAAASTVDVLTGGTLGGTGAINRAVTVDDGATLAPGNLGVGTLTVGALALATDSVCAVEMGPVNASDQIVVNGDLTLAGTLRVSAMAGFGTGRYEVFSYTGSLTDQGMALSVPPGSGKAALDTSAAGQVFVEIRALTGLLLTVR